MKILSRPKKNAEEYGKWAVNPYVGCSNQCNYCVAPDTHVFMADGSSKRIDDVQVGDEIYGVEKQNTGKYAITRAKVTAKAEVTKKPWRLTFSNGQQIVCSGDHRFLTERGWKYTSGTERGFHRRPFLTENNRMVCIPQYPVSDFDITDDYRRGYLSGIIRGDANLAEYHYDNYSEYPFRLALKEHEAIDRTRDYLLHFGIEVNETDFPMIDRTTKEVVVHKAIRKGGIYNYQKITSLIEWGDSREWLRGFMAGIYDAEGGKGRAKRMSNCNDRIISTYCKALDEFGIPYTFDKPKQEPSGKVLKIVRLKGGLLTSLFFVRACRPAITSLFDFEGSRLKFDNNSVYMTEKKKLTNPARLIDIETTTGNFFANGFVAHNCYLRKGPSGKYLGQDHPVLKKGVVNEEHACLVAMTEILENEEQIKKDGGLFFSFTTDPLLPDTHDVCLTIAAWAINHEIPVMMLTKCASFYTDGDSEFPSFHDLPFIDCRRQDKRYIWAPNADLAKPDLQCIAIGWTLTGHDELDSHAAPNALRIKAMKDLTAAGFKTWASIEPVIDFDSSFRMIQQALDAGCQHFKIGLMTERTKVCRRGFTLGGKTFEPYDPARCLAFVQDVMQATRDRATVYWKQSFRDFLCPVGSKRPKAERIGGTGKHRLFTDDEPMEQREQNGACSDYAESRQRSAESQLHKIFDDYPNAVGKEWSMFNPQNK